MCYGTGEIESLDFDDEIEMTVCSECEETPP